MDNRATLVTCNSGSSTITERQRRLTVLLEHLTDEGWTQSTLAEALGVDFTTVYRWSKGKTVPEVESRNFRRLAALTGGDDTSLELYLTGQIPLTAYRQGKQKLQTDEVQHQILSPEKIKQQLLAQIYMLDPVDIADVISNSVAFLAKRT
jgi:transcriptional regulator with XRE-family HTH domain